MAKKHSVRRAKSPARKMKRCLKRRNLGHCFKKNHELVKALAMAELLQNTRRTGGRKYGRGKKKSTKGKRKH